MIHCLPMFNDVLISRNYINKNEKIMLFDLLKIMLVTPRITIPTIHATAITPNKMSCVINYKKSLLILPHFLQIKVSLL